VPQAAVVIAALVAAIHEHGPLGVIMDGPATTAGHDEKAVADTA
jgi:hypothetical protein